MDTRFSIIMPAHNVAEYLEATLQSVRAQRWADFELIVVDDGSTDATPEILARAAQVDSRLRVITTPNQGVSCARNTGIAHATGTYLAFLDADDLWYPDHLEQAAAFFAQYPEVNWYATRFEVGTELPERDVAEDSASERAGKGGAPVFTLLRFFRSGHMRTWTSCVVLRRSALPEAELFPTELTQGEDTVAWMRFAARNPVLGCAAAGSRPTAFYRMRADSFCGSWRAAMEKAVEKERRFYESFESLEAPGREDARGFRLRRGELFASSFAGLLRQSSLASLLPVLRVHRRSCGLLLWLYMVGVVSVLRILSALFAFPLHAWIRLYRKIMRTWPR